MRKIFHSQQSCIVLEAIMQVMFAFDIKFLMKTTLLWFNNNNSYCYFIPFFIDNSLKTKTRKFTNRILHEPLNLKDKPVPELRSLSNREHHCAGDLGLIPKSLCCYYYLRWIKGNPPLPIIRTILSYGLVHKIALFLNSIHNYFFLNIVNYYKD